MQRGINDFRFCKHEMRQVKLQNNIAWIINKETEKECQMQ